MKEKMKKIMEKFHYYNSYDIAFQAFGLRKETEYDALVVAPSYTPHKLKELNFRTMVFIRAVGALNDSFNLGDICTPEYSISGGYANTYLKESIKDYVPFEKVTPDMEYVSFFIKLTFLKICLICSHHIIAYLNLRFALTDRA